MNKKNSFNYIDFEYDKKLSCIRKKIKEERKIRGRPRGAFGTYEVFKDKTQEVYDTCEDVIIDLQEKNYYTL
jgi:hypothetical protein